MQRHADYTQTRIRHLTRELAAKIYDAKLTIDDLAVSGPTDRISHGDAQKLTDFRPAKPGDIYGPQWATFWFRATAHVPAEWKGHRVDLLWDTQSESTLWIDGVSVQGLNMTSGDRPDAILIDKAKGGE